MECNFTFDGKHCLRDFDCVYIFAKSRPVSPESAFFTYEIGGADGDAIFGDRRIHQVMTHKGSLYLMHTPPTEAEALRIYRQISAWLKAGRRKLVFDYEPDRYLLAEAEASIEYSESGWPDGGISLEFRCQPFAYNLWPDMASGTLTRGAGAALALELRTGEPAPVSLTVKNTGAATLTGVTVAVGSKQVVMTGMAIPTGQALEINMEAPIGASVGAANALPYATRFDYLTAARACDVTVAATFGSGTAQAEVTARATGRWI